MLEIYGGNVKDNNRLSVGAAIQAALKNKNVLYVRFIRENTREDKVLSDRSPHITFVEPEFTVDPDDMTEEKRTQTARAESDYFDKAIRMALTFKYEVLLLDRIFDVIEAGLLSPSQVYEFLSDAPDRLEIICTGSTAEERFLDLADEAVGTFDMKQ